MNLFCRLLYPWCQPSEKESCTFLATLCDPAGKPPTSTPRRSQYDTPAKRWLALMNSGSGLPTAHFHNHVTIRSRLLSSDDDKHAPWRVNDYNRVTDLSAASHTVAVVRQAASGGAQTTRINTPATKLRYSSGDRKSNICMVRKQQPISAWQQSPIYDGRLPMQR